MRGPWNRHRQDNTIRVAEALWHRRELSRADLARQLRLDRSTVGSCVDDLLAAGVVEEKDHGPARPGGGRPPVLLTLTPRYGYILGIDLSGELMSLIAVDLAGTTIARRRLASPSAPEDLPFFLHNYCQELRRDLHRSGYSRLLTIGVGVSGMVDTSRGSVLLSRSLGISGSYPLGRELSQFFEFPLWVFNDADASGLGELEVSGRVGETDILFVFLRYFPGDSLATVRFNAGMGIVLNGRLRETYSGGGREFRSPFVSPGSSEQFGVVEKARRGELRSEAALFEELAEELGLSVSFLVHALDLRTVVVGGNASRERLPYPRFSEAIRHHVTSSTARLAPQPLEMRDPVAGTDAVAFGAAVGAARRLFRSKAFPIQKNAPLAREKAE